ncbi:MAG TPA: DUF2267 domain-containing protein [Chitinispirillaceae bacterium]|jgi:uncharacterized protein (DUF2267 family)|nr:DUF2267 domain-containing protein [Chitinispirillaceae bacterium]
MQYTEFIQEVCKRGNIPDYIKARKIVEVCMSTLGQRLPTTLVAELGAQLSLEMKENLHSLNDPSKSDTFTLEEFYNRVSARAKTGYPDAVRLSRVVMETLKLAVTDAVLSKVLQKLPAQFGELFGQEPTDPLSPTIE